uniref:Ribonuclease II/R domain-containing protein n=1 Tax=Ditylenchus dipsaci TaxID=166011 RepID=A0A915DEC5_9BILA
MSENRASSSFDKMSAKDEKLSENDGQQNRKPVPDVCLGRISVDDLLGGATSPSVETLTQNPGRRSGADNAFHRLGLDEVASFPSGFPSLTRRPDYQPQPNFLQPEIFMAAMAAAQQVVNEQSMRNSPEGSNSYVCSKCTYSSASDLLSLGPNNTSPRQNFAKNAFSPRPALPHDKKIRYSGVHGAAFSNIGMSPPSVNYSPQQSVQKIRKPFFSPYITQVAADRGLKSGTYIKGTLRINQRNFEEAYVDNPETKPKGSEQQDVMIIGVHDRNRALHGDVVILRLKERNEWCPQTQFSREPLQKSICTDSISNDGRYPREVMLKLAFEMDPTGRSLVRSKSTKIKETQSTGVSSTLPKTAIQKNPTAPVQRLYSSGQQAGHRRSNYRLLSDLPDDDWGMPDVCLQKTAEVVYIAEQKNSRSAVGLLKVMADGNRNWALFSPNDSRMPRMMIPYIFVASIAEWQATAQFARGLLIANSVDTREFPMAAIKSLPFDKSNGWKIDDMEVKYRKDFRSYTIFTIDPLTARDLDDALHVKRLADCDGKGNPGWEMNTELDSWACSRGNTVYLVHTAIPMLPNILCEDLCSLNPDVERLTFSVVWKLNEKAGIVDEWFGRSIIKSCAKLAYEHAQEIIDDSEKRYEEDGFPKFRMEKRSKTLSKQLSTSTRSLKFSRTAEWKAELFVWIILSLEKREAANHLAFPKIALLRRHRSPKPKTLREVVEMCNTLSYPIVGDCGKTIASSLLKYSMDPALKDTVHPVLVNMIMKSMQLAEYFCTGAVRGESDWHHYALHIDQYTHFTSPIRRYPDVIVHRFQANRRIAQNCNDKKWSAKFVYETNAEMFFGLLVKKLGSLDLLGVVVGVLDSAFDVLLVKYGIIKQLKLGRDPRYVDGLPPALVLHWDSSVGATDEFREAETSPSTREYRSGTNAVVEQTLRIMSIVRVVLTPAADPPKYNAVIVPSPDKKPLTFEDMAAYIASDDGLSGNLA